MAHFAKIGLNNKVINVVAVDNRNLEDSNGIEQEQNGINFLESITGSDTTSGPLLDPDPFIFFCKILFLLVCSAINDTAHNKPINIRPMKKKGRRTINHAIFLPYLN